MSADGHSNKQVLWKYYEGKLEYRLTEHDEQAASDVNLGRQK